MKIDSIMPNYYCNQTKANKAPAFKGQYLDDDTWALEQVGVSPKTRKDINQFLEEYMSPCVNVASNSSDELYFAPWYDGWHSIKLLEIPEECCKDKIFYITNAKAIEDDVLDSMINYLKERNLPKLFKDEDIRDNFTKCIEKQQKYFDTHKDRFPAIYEAKFNILKNILRREGLKVG